MLRDSMRYGAALCAVVFLLASSTDAATPANGTLKPDQRTLTYTFPFSVAANISGASEDTYTCNTGPSDPCDIFELTLDLPADFKAAHPNDFLRIQAGVTSEASDIDLQLADENGDLLVSYRDNPPAQPFIEFTNLQNGSTTYQIQVVPGSPHEGGSVTVELVDGGPPPPPDADNDGIPDVDDTCPGTPPGSSVDEQGCPVAVTNPNCIAPGTAMLTDAAGDSIGEDDTDLLSASVSETVTSQRNLVFTVQMASLATLTNNARRIVTFRNKRTSTVYYVAMISNPSAPEPAFAYGTGTAGFGGTDALGAGLPGSGYSAANGTFVVVAPISAFGLVANDQLDAFTGDVRLSVGDCTAGCVNGASADAAAAPAANAYTLVPNGACPVDAPPPQLPASGQPPRFYDFQSPAGLGDSAGEPTIGYNPATKNAMFIAGLEVDRVTFAENAWTPPLNVVDAAGLALPEACEPEWQDKSYAGAVNTLDPILETEQISGRTFQSSLSGANSIFAFSDDDGDSWIPAQAGPPNGGADHQTVGVGPWAPGAKPPTATEDYAVYYCSQSVVAAFCSRSDNGGVSFGPGIDFRDTLTDCDNTVGGLHGHVQVARNDGTVYVPFGNCGTKAGVAVSTDSGITWTVKKIQQSAAGDDPGLGIADDGTAFMCYSEGTGGKTYASVSKDRGQTWSGHYDLGASLGIKHTVFTTAVAGDGGENGRAACAFLGTTDEGNPEAEDFEGVWYPYVAVTYDGGDSWHTVNVAPNDPVQGWGGICLSGTLCGGNRNLLDFNDIIIDDQGRMLFGYADGCKGACTNDPTKNTFSDNGVIARQSGGRTLRAAFDDTGLFNTTAPVKPGAACASETLSRRTSFETRVAWKAPDTGGSEITNYKVYRATAAAGPFSFVGDAGKKNYLIDPTADPTVPEYYYRVVAENAQGAAPVSNVIELPITVPVDESSCTLPGVTVASEGSAGACTGTGGACTPQTDAQSLHVAELQSDPGNIVITVKVASLDPAPAPGLWWYVLTKKQDGSNLYVGMDTSSGAPAFTYGTYEVGTVTTFTPQGTLAGSSFETNGAIHLVVPRALFGGLDVGDIVSALEIRTRQGDSAAPSRDVVGPGDYVVRGTNVCYPNTPPVAVLRATPQFGGTPLQVSFDGADSFDNDVDVPDSITTWVINFGDGTGATAESSDAAAWTHTYAAPGVYSARLRVTDSRGLQSENPAEKVISVEVPGTGNPANADASNNRLGGSLSGGALLVLALLGALRRRLARVAVVLGLCAVATSAGALPERASYTRAEAVARLQANAGGDLVRHGSALTASTLLRAERGATLFADGGAGTPAERAQLFLSLHGQAVGVRDPASELRLQRVSRDLAGNAHVHLDQVHQGVPVFGARLVVHLNGDGVTGVNGAFLPDLDRMPMRQLPLARLRAAALAYSRKFNGAADLRIESGRFVVYPIGLLRGHYGGARLAYEAFVTGGSALREFVFIDAGTGAGLNRISQVHTVLNREIYTPEQQTPTDPPVPVQPTLDEQASTVLIPEGPADPALINDPGHGSTDESDSVAGDPPTDNLWLFAGGTYALYDNMFGRKGYDACDGAGPCQPDTPAPAWSATRGEDYVGQLQKSVYLVNDACPNAYWNGDSTNYCPGFDADDIVSHEWSHAYTQYTHGLIYQYQSGALNESYSDIFGESYDLVNHLEGPLGSTTLVEHQYYEDGGNRWVVGEDLSEEAAALLLRDMWKPEDFPAANPGKATSGDYTCGSGDNGGVHANSSVPNHAFAMLVDGTAGQGPDTAADGTFERDNYNGQQFTGIGLVRAAHIYFHAMVNYQTPSTDFPQHADALRASCQDLKGVALKDPTGATSADVITQAHCDILEKAMLATEMDLGTPCPYIPVLAQGAPAICEGASTIFQEDWEGGVGDWTKTSTGVNAEWNDDSRSLRDFVLDSTLPGARAGTAAYARNAPLGEPGGGDCQPGSGDYSGQFTFDSETITIPADAAELKVRFDHYVATEAGFDGGQLEVSVDGGAFALVPEDNYEFNAPNSEFDAAPPIGLNTNPNGGELAWHGTDINPPSGAPPSQWGTTIVDLTGIAGPGDTVKLRLTFSQDGCNGVDGWYVDDIKLYSCPALEAPTLTTSADYEDPDIDGTYSLEWERPVGAEGPDLLQESTVSCTPAIADDAEDGLGQWTATTDDEDFGPVWTDSTARPKPLHLSTAFWASANSDVVFGTSWLTFKQPIVIPDGASATLRFSDWYVNEPEDKGSVEVSKDGGATWVEVYSINRAIIADEASAAFAAEALTPRAIDLSAYAGETIRLRFKMFIGGSEFFAYNQYGWYVDDIALEVGLWNDVTTTTQTFHTFTGKPNGTACYRVRTKYEVAGGILANSEFSATVPATVELDLNQLPVAVAGLDKRVNEGTSATLNGSGSSDPDGDPLTYAWEQVSGPDGTLDAADTVEATFTAPEVCTDELAVFELTVTDPDGLSASDQVTLTVDNVNNNPIANAGEDFTIFEGKTAMLSAASSADGDCEPLAYHWEQIAGPAVTLTGADTATPSFEALAVDTDTLLRFRLVVEDLDGVQAADEVDVTVVDAIGNAKVGAIAPWQLLVLALAGLAGLRRRKR